MSKEIITSEDCTDNYQKNTQAGKLFMYKHTGPIVDCFNHQVKKGDKILRLNVTGRSIMGRHLNYVVDIDEKKGVLFTKVMNNDGTLRDKVTKITSIRPDRMFIDLEWRVRHEES